MLENVCVWSSCWVDDSHVFCFDARVFILSRQRSGINTKFYVEEDHLKKQVVAEHTKAIEREGVSLKSLSIIVLREP